MRLMNNDQSVNTLNNLKGSIENRIKEIYNLGYKEGYKDGQANRTVTIDSDTVSYQPFDWREMDEDL